MSEELQDAPEPETPYDAGDPTKVKAKKTELKHRQKDLDLFLKAAMDTTPGRKWLWYMLEQSRVFQSSFDTRALTMAFNEGQRNFGLILMADIMRVCPDLYIKMAQENGEDK